MNEPESSPHLIDSTTLADLLLRAVIAHPEQDALVFPDNRQTYAELWARSVDRARCLHAAGVGPRDHVGILMPNCPEYIEFLMGIAMLGAVCVPINARNKAKELAYVIENADLKGLITSDAISEYADFGQLLFDAFDDLETAKRADDLKLRAAPMLKFVLMLGAPKAGFVTEADFTVAGQSVTEAHVNELRQRVAVRDRCIMMYTSGTTADPKGCPLSHEALVRNGINMNRERYLLNAEDRLWTPLPMFHMASILPLVCCFDAGAATLSMRRFEADVALRMLAEERVTVAFPAFPTIMNDLLSHPTFADTDLSRLKRMNNVAPPEVLKQFQAAIPQAVLTSAYGLTEAGGVISYNHPAESLEKRTHTCGEPFPGLEVKIVDPETRDSLGIDERGELAVRGYSLFEGYYKSPQKNAEAFVDGWLYTGDLCSLDTDGAISFHGRSKDMLKVGGENVAAMEIESHLAQHADIKFAQVIGVPDERLTEVAAAFVELHEGKALSADEVIAHCTGQMASFKVPRHVRFVTEWPMSSTKVQKFRLLDQF